MSKVKLNRYEKGLADGGKIGADKLEQMAESFRQEKTRLDNYIDDNDRVQAILHKSDGYNESLEKVKKERVRIEEAKTQFTHYNIAKTYPVFDELSDSHSVCWYFLGEIFYNGYGDIEKDLKKSSECFQCGYYSDDILCRLKLAEYFPTLLPDSVLPTDIYNKALEQLPKISYPRSILDYELAYMHEMGFGCDISNEKAYILYERAASTGYFKGLYGLYRCFSEGIGVEKDEAKAQQYLKDCRRINYIF